MNYTSIEQSKRLLELGLDPDTADMFWINGMCGDDKLKCFTPSLSDSPDYEYDLPCWSIGALISLVPNYRINSPKGYKTQWEAFSNDISVFGENPLDATYDLVVFILQNNHIKI